MAKKAEVERVENFRPTPECINALPEALRSFIHDLETRCDPAGDVAARRLAEDNRDALATEVEQLREALQHIVEYADMDNNLIDYARDALKEHDHD